METLWHEIGHNRQAHVMLDSMTINQRVIAESLRQTLARQTYPEFLAIFGLEPLHLQTIRASGLCYMRSAGTLKNLLLEIGAMDAELLAIAPDVLADLSAIDTLAEWDVMQNKIAEALIRFNPENTALITQKLQRLADRYYD